MPRILESRRLMAIGIFDLEDRYARELRVGESHPRPIGDVRIVLVGRMVGGQREEFPEPLTPVIRRNPSGYHLFFGRVKAWDGVDRAVLSPGTYIVRVESQFYQPTERDDIVLPRPDAAYFFDLQPGVAYPFPARVSRSAGPTLLRGSLHHQGGAPIAGALIEVAAPGAAATPYRTGEDGQWVLAFPLGQPSGDVAVRITLPDAVPVVLTAQVVQGRETSLQQTALRGWVVNAAGFGIRGATITVSGQPGQSTTDADGRWFYYFALDQPAAQVRVTAALPDGQSLSQDNQPVQPGAATMVPTFRFV
jgi:hypothetical protein